MAKKHSPELKLEQVQEKINLHFLCLLEYRRENFLCVIDNITPSSIGAYVLDYAEQENVTVDKFLSLVTEWFYSNSENHPLSVEFARRGLTEGLAPIYRTFDTTYVSRIIGNAFSYEGMAKSKVRRRRVIPIPAGVAIKLKKPV
jgi:hypothetical protein